MSIPDRPAILAALKRKRVVFPVRDGLATRVFAEPPIQPRFEPRSDPTAESFLRVVAPHMARLGHVMTNAPRLGTEESRVRQRTAVDDILGLLRRHLNRGGNLASIRAGMLDAFRPESMAVLAQHEAAFDPMTKLEAVEVVEPEKRLPNNLPPHERILGMLRAAGRRGLWRTEIRMRFQHPRPRAAEVDAMLDEIEGEGMIASAELALYHGGKAGTRYFHSDYGLPRVVAGIAVFLEDSEDDEIDTAPYRH